MNTPLDPATWVQLGVGALLTVLWWALRNGIAEIKTDVKSLMSNVGTHMAAIEVLKVRLDRIEDEMGDVKEQLQQLDRREHG